MKLLRYLLLALAFTSFQSALAQSKQVSFSSKTLGQGDTLLVIVKNAQSLKEIAGTFNKKPIGFFQPAGSNSLIGIAGIDAKRQPGSYSVTVTSQGKALAKSAINVTKTKFKITMLEVTPKLKAQGFTPAKIIQSVARENAILNAILLTYAKTAYFEKPFIQPIDTVQVSGAFGEIRKNGSTSAQHLGTDFETALNTPVRATNSGIVVYAKELSIYGKILVIDHGLGIFSLYLHLNEFKVSAGQRVAQGDIIALSGNTGYSTAPHLHFSIKILGASVDPLKFIETMRKITEL